MSLSDDARSVGYDLLGDPRSGGTSEVYRARSIETGDIVAFKVLLRRGDARLEREARIGRGIDDPRLALPDATGVLADGRAFAVSRWVEGISLRDLLDESGPLQRGVAMGIVGDIGAALGVLHRRGALHRDVTPSNVIVGDEHAVLIDVGHGRVSGGPDVTATGDLAGTPRYVAPEVIRGEEAGPASDQYALGLIAYEVLAGRWPFPDGTTAATALHHQLHTEPEPVDEIDPRVPTAVASAVHVALAKSPQDRWRSVEDFLAALDDRVASVARPRSRRRVGALAAVAGAISVGLAGVVATGAGDGAEPVDDSTDSVTLVTEIAEVAEVTEVAEVVTVATTTPGAAVPVSTEIPAEIPSSFAAGTADQLDCNLLVDAGFDNGFVGDNYFDNDVDAAADGRERVLPSGGVDGGAVLVVGEPGVYGRYGEVVPILPGQRYTFAASVLGVEPLNAATVAISWLDEDFALLESVRDSQSVVGVEPGRVFLDSGPAPDTARYAVPELFKDGSAGLLLADELVFAESAAGCGDGM